VRVLGALRLRKNGQQNDRLIGCPISLPGAASTWDEVRELADVSPRLLRELEGFMTDHQTFEGNVIELDGFINGSAAMQAVREAHHTWRERNS
jgi:inorganic pyrophosphatase